MKLLVLIIFFSFSSFAGITIVSDLDDTIKITSSGGNPTDALKHKVFAGLPDFFQGARNYIDNLTVVSGSPNAIHTNVEETLKRNNIQFEGLVLKKKVEDIAVFKLREIKKIMENSDDQFIFIGDDTAKDPFVYTELSRLYPGRVLAIYIHVVKGTFIPENITFYWTAFDLTLRENEAGRMWSTEVEKTFHTLMDSQDDFIFPRRANCPTNASIWAWQSRTIFSEEARTLSEKLTHLCQVRQSGIILP